MLIAFWRSYAMFDYDIAAINPPVAVLVSSLKFSGRSEC